MAEIPGVLKTGSASCNFLCTFHNFSLSNISFLSVLVRGDVNFFACFLVRDLCRSGRRHPATPSPAPSICFCDSYSKSVCYEKVWRDLCDSLESSGTLLRIYLVSCDSASAALLSHLRGMLQ